MFRRKLNKILLFVAGLLFVCDGFGQSFDPTSSNDNFPTGGEVSSSNEGFPLDIVCTSCAGSPNSETFRVLAVDDFTTNVDNAYFEWVVYGGSIISNSGSYVDGNSQSVGGVTRQYIKTQGTDAGYSFITVQYDTWLPETLWVAVRQSSEFGCTDHKWSVHLMKADDVDPEIQFADSPEWMDSLVVVTNGSDFDLYLNSFSDDVHSATNPISSPSVVNVDPIPYDADCDIDEANSTINIAGETWNNSYGIGTHVFVSKAYDCQGNDSTFTQHLFVYDEADFSLSAPDDYKFPSNNCAMSDEEDFSLDTHSLVINYPAGWAPRDTTWLPISSENYSGSGCVFNRTRYYTVTLVHINNHNTYDITATRTYSYIVDNEAPTLTTKDIIIELDETGEATINPVDIVQRLYDNCIADTANIIVDMGMSGPFSFDCSMVGDNTVTLQVADSCGNSISETATVTVEDIIPAIVECLPDTSVFIADGRCDSTINIPGPDVTDACIDSIYWTMTGATTSEADRTSALQYVGNFSFNVGVTTVTYYVKETNGNTTSCSFNVEVKDNIPPVAIGNGMVILLDETGSAEITVSDIDNGSYDNCDFTLSLSDSIFDCSDFGRDTIQIIATDLSGNTAESDVYIIIRDAIPPTAVCKTDVENIYLDVNGIVNVDEDYLDGGSFDNCSDLFFSYSPTYFECGHVGEQDVTLIVYDKSNNQDQCKRTVNVIDTIAPRVLVQDNIVYIGSSGQVTVTADDVDNGTWDNCGTPTMTISADGEDFRDSLTYDCDNQGETHTIWLKAVDVGGLERVKSAKITIESDLSIDDIYVDDCGFTDLARTGTGLFETKVVGQRFVSQISGGGGGLTYQWGTPVDDANVYFVKYDYGPWYLLPRDIYTASSDAPHINYPNHHASAPWMNPYLSDGYYYIDLRVSDTNGCEAYETMGFDYEDRISGSTTEYDVETCEGATVTYNARSSLPSNATFTWITNDTECTVISGGGVSDRSITVFFDKEGVSEATITYVAESSDFFLGCEETYQINVTITPMETPSFVNPETEPCPFDTVTYTLDSLYTTHWWEYEEGVVWEGGTASDSFVTMVLGYEDPAYVIGHVMNDLGCQSSDTVTIDFFDDSDPYFTSTPNDTSHVNAPGSCGFIFTNLPAPLADDDCGKVRSIINDYTETGNASGVYPVGTTTVTWTATDYAERTVTHEQLITVTDDEDPYFIAQPGNLIAYVGETSCIYTHNADNWDAEAYDECTTSGATYTVAGVTTVIDGSNTTLNGQQFDLGTTTVTWIAEDTYGNTANWVHTIEILDTISPSIAGSLTDLTIEDCDVSAAPPAFTTVAQLETEGLEIADNCSADNAMSVTSVDEANGTCPIIVTRTYTVSDENGNSRRYVRTIIIDDTTDPVVSEPADVTIEACSSADIDDGTIGTSALAYSESAVVITEAELNGEGITASDNCNIASITYEDATNGNSCPEVITRTFTITDDCGNQTVVDYTITIDDTTDPVVSEPADVTIEACSSADINDGTVGSSDLAYSEIAVDITEAELNGEGITVSDNCNIASITYEDATDGNSCPEVITRTFTVTDDCGNQTVVDYTITIDDTTDPVVSEPADVTIEACSSADINDGTVGSSDLAYSEIAVDITEAELNGEGITVSDNCNIASITYVDATDGNSCPEVITRTFTVTDDCGNQTVVDYTITIDDTTPPTVDEPVDVSIEACVGFNNGDAVGASSLVYSTTAVDITMAELNGEGINASDNCNIASITYVDATDGNSCPEVITRTFTVTDDCGNQTVVDYTITIDDTTDPVVSEPADVTIEACSSADIDDGTIGTSALAYSESAVVITMAELNVEGITVSDNCNIASITYEDATDGNSCPEVITRTFTVTDDCGNQTVVDYTITIDDTTDPVVSEPADVTIEACSSADIDDGTIGTSALAYSESAVVITMAELNVEGITASDNCNIASITYEDATDGNSCPEVITRTFTVTDDCGNQTVVDYTITIDDTTDPVVSEPADVTIEACSSADINDGTVGSSDLAYSEIAVDITEAELNGEGITVSDNCNIASITYVDATDGNSCPEVITRTFTVTDDCGNQTVVDYTITIDDTTDPVVSEPADVTIEACSSADIDDGTIGTSALAYSESAVVITMAELNGEGITASDNCNIASITYEDATDGNSCPEVITRTFTVTDDCGNQTVVDYTITIDDTTDPVVSEPADVTIEACSSADIDDGTIGTSALAYSESAVVITMAELNGEGITASDNCNIASITYEDATDGNSCPEVITRTFTVTDDCGNQTVVDYTITIDDTTDPVVSEPADVTIEACSSADIDDGTIGTSDLAYSESAVVITMAELNGEGITASDNCNIASITYEDATDGNSCPEVITRTFTVTDDCGNQTVVDYTITIDDTTVPTFTAPADITISTDAYCNYDASITATGDVTDEADNCSVGIEATFVDVITNDNATFPHGYTITRTWSLVDDCGNAADDQIQIITVRDEIAPTIDITTPYDVTECATVEADQSTNLTLTLSDDDFDDNCTTDEKLRGTVQYQIDHQSDNTYDVTTWQDAAVIETNVEITTDFYEGVSYVTLRVTDENTNISTEVHGFKVTIYHLPTPTNITPGTGEASEGVFGGPNQPLRYSTHSYQITLNEADNYSAGDWSMEDSDGNLIMSGYVFDNQTINGSRTASIDVTFNMDPGTYYLVYIENTSDGCLTSRKYEIRVEDPFDVDVAAEDADCHDESGNINSFNDVLSTVHVYTITLVSLNYSFDWSFDYEITGHTATIANVSAMNAATHTNTNNSPFGSVTVAGGTTSVTITVTYAYINGTPQQDIKMSLTNITGSYSEIDVDGTTAADNQDLHTIYALPAPGDIQGVE